MAYFIGHVQKFKANDIRGMEIHCERLSKNSINKDIDWSRTKDNYNLVANAQSMRQRVAELVNSRSNPENKALRKDAIVLCSVMVSASSDFFQGKSPEAVRAYFTACHEYLCSQYGRENCTGAYVHIDETTPHMHWTFVPLTQDLRLSSKEVNARKNLLKLQSDMPKYLQQCGFNVERGVENSPRYHVDTKDWKRAELLKEATQRKLQELLQVTPSRWMGKNVLSDESYQKLRSVAEFAVTTVGNKEEVKRQLHEQEEAIRRQRAEVEQLQAQNAEQEAWIVQKQRQLQKKEDELLTQAAILQGKREDLKVYEAAVKLQDQDIELQRMRDRLREEQQLLEQERAKMRQREELLQRRKTQLEQGEAAAYARVHEAAQRAVLQDVPAEDWERMVIQTMRKENPDLYEKLINDEKQKSVQENLGAAIEEMKKNNKTRER